jgi:hypothetical protein
MRQPEIKIRALATTLIALDLAYDMESQESGILLQENTTEKYENSIQEIQMVSWYSYLFIRFEPQD